MNSNLEPHFPGLRVATTHLEFCSGLRVGELLRIDGPGAAEKHVEKRPDPDLPLDLLVALEGVLREVGEEGGHEATLRDLEGPIEKYR